MHSDDHLGMLGGSMDAIGNGRSRRRADDVGLAHEADQVRDVTAARAFDVVGVNRTARDRGDSVLELAGLIEPVGVQRDRDIIGVGEAEHRVDDLRICAPVLVDLEADGAGRRGLALSHAGASVLALACSPRFTGSCSKARSVALIAAGGSSKPAVIRVVTPALSATGISRGVMRCTCESTAPAVAISP